MAQPSEEKMLLLVEDDDMIRDVVMDALIDGGFDVVAMSSGADAVEQLEDNALRFRAVVTDVQLGAGPDGWDVAKRARELLANMPIVYMTGSDELEWHSRGVPHSVMVGKPFAPAQIVTAVSILINEIPSH